jgi:DNA-binding IclR family transcriptional regulator
MSDYTVEAQQRILRLVMTLAGNEVHGLTNSAVAKLQGCSPSQATRDLQNLLAAGFAEHVPDTNGWRLSPMVIRMSVAHATALDKADRRLDEIKTRFSGK